MKVDKDMDFGYGSLFTVMLLDIINESSYFYILNITYLYFKEHVSRAVCPHFQPFLDCCHLPLDALLSFVHSLLA